MFFCKYHFILNDILTASFSNACFMLLSWSESLMTRTLFFNSARYFTFWSQESSIASRSYYIVLYWWDWRAGRCARILALWSLDKNPLSMYRFWMFLIVSVICSSLSAILFFQSEWCFTSSLFCLFIVSKFWFIWNWLSSIASSLASLITSNGSVFFGSGPTDGYALVILPCWSCETMFSSTLTILPMLPISLSSLSSNMACYSLRRFSTLSATLLCRSWNLSYSSYSTFSFSLRSLCSRSMTIDFSWSCWIFIISIVS